jgi:hypothetical protein
LQAGNERSAVDALARAGKVAPETGKPFRYRVDAAYRLLQKGYGRDVLAYAETALKVTPNDADLKALRDQAQLTPRKR